MFTPTVIQERFATPPRKDKTKTKKIRDPERGHPLYCEPPVFPKEQVKPISKKYADPISQNGISQF